ncbi:MAG: NfeD family protein [Pseudomonadota bacterium]
MNWFSPAILIALGFALLAAEVAIFGFSVFILFFIGLACIVSGGFIAIGLFDATLGNAMGLIAFFSVVFAVTLWKPLKKMQNSGITHEVKGDFIGHSFVLATPCSAHEYSTHRMSGVDWKVRSNTPLAAGTPVHVIKVEVGELTVAAQ